MKVAVEINYKKVKKFREVKHNKRMVPITMERFNYDQPRLETSYQMRRRKQKARSLIFKVTAWDETSH